MPEPQPPASPAPELSPCVLVVKTPVASRQGMANRLAQSGRLLAGQIAGAASEHALTLAVVEEALAARGVSSQQVSVDALDAAARRAISAARLVVSLGGDGTLLAASHWVTDGLLLGVNSAPRSSVGFLTLARRSNFARVLNRIARGTLQPVRVARLATELEGRHLPPALNDVLIAHERPAATSRYRLRLGRRSEEHRSSGLWVSTAAGSTAGIHSAGGRKMPLRSRRLQFRARELYRARGRADLASGFVPAGGELVVESSMEAGWIYVDGSRLATRFPFGARATFRTADRPLLLFADPARWPRA